jgi:hypothetical protein
MPDDEPDYAGEALAASRARHPTQPRPPSRVPEPGTTPTLSIVAGIVTIVFGGVLAGLAGGGFIAAVGSIVVVLGLVVAGIGVVAAGVRLGMQWTDYDRKVGER